MGCGTNLFGARQRWRLRARLHKPNPGDGNSGPPDIAEVAHLRRVLTSYSLYYNETRTHLGLGKDAPLRRAVQRSGTITVTPILSGLHHRYARI
jgi:hypothetical protein